MTSTPKLADQAQKKLKKEILGYLEQIMPKFSKDFTRNDWKKKRN